MTRRTPSLSTFPDSLQLLRGALDAGVLERSLSASDLGHGIFGLLRDVSATEPVRGAGGATSSLTALLMAGPAEAQRLVLQRFRGCLSQRQRANSGSENPNGGALPELPVLAWRTPDALLLAAQHSATHDVLSAFLSGVARLPLGSSEATAESAHRPLRLTWEGNAGCVHRLLDTCWRRSTTPDALLASAVLLAFGRALPSGSIVEAVAGSGVMLPFVLRQAAASADDLSAAHAAATRFTLESAPTPATHCISVNVASPRGVRVHELELIDWLHVRSGVFCSINVLVRRSGISLCADLMALPSEREACGVAWEHLVELLDPPALLVRRPKVPAASSEADNFRDLDACGNVTEAFFAVAARSPHEIAIAHEGRHVGYAELASGVLRIAASLAARGVGAGSLVALCLDRSVDAIAAMLATHRIGASYVPIAPDVPRERLRTILDELGARYVLCEADFAHLQLVQECGLSPLGPGDLTGGQHGYSLPAFRSDSPAYVLHTSGSTGAPKAVANTHAGLKSRLRWMRDELKLTGRDVIIQKTPFTFDVSVWEVFLPLVTGARLLLAKPGGHADPWHLGELLDRGATCMHFVPSMLAAFVSSQVQPKVAWRLRHLICSGEALPPELIQRARAAFPETILHNYYGPTEASIDVTRWRVSPIEGSSERVPIGAPAPGVVVHVLSEDGAHSERGTAGELCLGGVQLALGYLNSAKMTAARFLPDPFSAEPGARMYATGDFGRWRDDDLLDYLGRKDGQVKIRGMRVELEEIDRAVQRVCGIARCVATAGEDEVYLLVAVRDLDRYRPALLADDLPSHMVPQRVVGVTEFPLTSSGKTDRRRALEMVRQSERVKR